MSVPGGSPLRVLVVDDDADQRYVVRHLLVAAGIDDVAEAGDADGALEVGATFDPDLVILDLAMPGRSGLEVLPELRAAAPRARVIILSNLPRHRLVQQARDRGALGYVEKQTAPWRLVTEILVAASLVDATVRSTTFPAQPTSARAARRFVREVIDETDTELIANTELLVSELVSNAVAHASSPPRVDVHLTPAAVRVEVYDLDGSVPAPLAPEPTAVGGRGLLLVERIASRWGAEPHDDGKVVWFELDRTPPS